MVNLLIKILAILVFTLVAGCASMVPSGEVHTIQNHHGRVAQEADGVWQIKAPPQLEFTGRTVTGGEIRRWAAQHGIEVVGIAADASYAQITSESAIACILWLKRFQWDIGYAYIGDARDCDNFARSARTFPDLFAEAAPPDSQAAVFGIYAKMAQPFAGVSDGYHALNVAWTDKGVPVFEPQGIHLTYQDLRYWPNRKGITHTIFD